MTALAAIPTGLQGYEQGISQGLSGLDYLQNRTQQAQVQAQQRTGQGLQRAANLTNRGINRLTESTAAASQNLKPYAASGSSANDVMAALSGAMGNDAQAQAFENYNSSPGMQFAQDRAEQAILRNAAATGGTQGANVLQELNRNAVGYAQQDFNNQFNRLGQLSGQGLQAASTIGGMQQNMGMGVADMLSGQGARTLQAMTGLGANQSNMAMTEALTAQGALQNAGLNVANARMDTGNQIADSLNQTRTALAGNQGGEGLAQMLGGNAQGISNLLIAAQSGDAQASEALATILANIATGSASNVAGRAGIPGVQQTSGILGGLGQLAGGIGGMMTGYAAL